eukprot:6643821-Prymnesium_polylepis.1
MCLPPQVTYRGAKAAPQQTFTMPAKPQPPRSAAGLVLYHIQDFIITNLHWAWLIGLFGSLFVYGPFSWAFFLNVLFTLLPAMFVPGSEHRRLHKFQRPIMSEFLRDTRVVSHAPPSSYTSGRRCVFAIAPHGALPIAFWPLTFVAHDVFRK